MKINRRMKWFKFWAAEWLLGTSHDELTPEQRAIFLDLLCKACMGIPPGSLNFYSFSQLSHQFHISAYKLQKCVTRLVEVNKILYDKEQNVIKIINWEKYQYDQENTFSSENGDQKNTITQQKDTLLDKIREDKIREEDNHPVSSNQDYLEKRIEKENERAKQELEKMGITIDKIIKPT